MPILSKTEIDRRIDALQKAVESLDESVTWVSVGFPPKGAEAIVSAADRVRTKVYREWQRLERRKAEAE
jgi:hypothetical protein